MLGLFDQIYNNNNKYIIINDEIKSHVLLIQLIHLIQYQHDIILF